MPAAWRKHWRVGLAALAVKLVLLALLAWWWHARNDGRADARQQELQGGGAAADAPAHLGSAAPSTSPSAPSAPKAASFAAQIARASGTGPLTVELCGVGRVDVKRPEAGQRLSPDERLPHLFEHALAAAWPQVLAALEQSPVERGRAAALALRAAGLPETDSRDPREFVRQLAQTAARSRDPQIYQWAWSLCTRAPEAPECRELSPQGWLDRAPDDVRGWLLLAQASAAQRDSALRRAAQAETAAPLPALIPWVDGAMPPGMPPYLRLEMLVQTVGIEAAFADRAYFFALAHCRERSDARDICSALADNLARRGTDTFSLSMARALGRHAGWAPERIAAVDTLDQELSRLALSEDPTETYTCNSVERTTAWFRDRATLGERAALRQRIAADKLSGSRAPSAASR